MTTDLYALQDQSQSNRHLVTAKVYESEFRFYNLTFFISVLERLTKNGNAMKSGIIQSILSLVRLAIFKPWLSLLLIVGLVIGSMPLLQGLKLDTSNESYLNKDDPIREHFLNNRKIYGGDNIVTIGIETPNGSVFDKAYLQMLSQYHEAISLHPLVYRVESLANVREVRGEEDELIIEKADEDFDAILQNLKVFEQTLLANPIYVNKLFSEDKHLALVNVILNNFSSTDPGAFLTDIEMQEAVQAIFDLTDQYRADDLNFYFSGIPTVTYRITKSLEKTMGLLTTLSMLVMVILLSIIFRRVSGVIVPCSMIFFSLLLTFEAMVFTNTTALVSIQIIPSLVIAFGICDSVHFLTVFFKRFAESGNKCQAIIETTEKTAFALFMTTVTTAAGLISFAFTDMPPVAFLGTFGAVGIIAAFLLTFTLMPALLMVIRIKPLAKKVSKETLVDRLCLKMTQTGIHHPFKTLAVSLLVLIGFMVLVTQLRFAHETVKWYKPEDPLRADIETIDAYLKGHFTVDVIITHKDGGSIASFEVLELIDDIRHYAVTHAYQGVKAGSTSGVTDMIRETHRALNDNDETYYRVPHDEELLAQELLLFEMGSSEDLYLLTEPGFESTRFILNMPATDLIKSFEFTNEIQAAFKDKVPEGYELRVTGTPTLAGQAFGSMLKTMSTSYIIAFVIISILIVLISSLRIGAMAIVVNLVPLAFTLSTMALLDIPLDIFTMLVGSIMLGVVVDDSIHYIEKLKIHLGTAGIALPNALLNASSDIGRSLFFTTTIVGIGFLTYAFSDLQNIFAFGVLVFSTAVVALIADLMLLPAMLMLFSKRKEQTSSALTH